MARHYKKLEDLQKDIEVPKLQQREADSEAEAQAPKKRSPKMDEVLSRISSSYDAQNTKLQDF